MRCKKHRGIAQLVEYRSPKPWVVGSSPSAPAINKTDGFLPSVLFIVVVKEVKTRLHSLQGKLCECSSPSAPAKSLGRFRSDREKTRKAEFSKDFSAFFDPDFFEVFTDPFSIFFESKDSNYRKPPSEREGERDSGGRSLRNFEI